MTVRTIILTLLLTVALSQNCNKSQVVFGDTCFDQCPPGTVYSFRRGVTSCQECDITKFFILSANQLKCQCALQTFYSQDLDLCIPCHYTCLTCRGQSNRQCLTCDTSTPTSFRVLSGQQCLCPSGYFDNVDLQQIKCVSCHQDCQNCTGSQQTDCINCAIGRTKNQFNQCICDNGFTEDEAGKCVCPYPLTVFPDGTCKDSVSLCGIDQQNSIPKNIAKAAKGSCACKAGLVKIKGKCKTCKLNQIYNPQKGKCQCNSKANSHKGQCIVCPSNQQFNKRTGLCDCPKHTQKTQTEECIKCPNKTVYKGGGICGCVFNYYLDKNGKCKKCSKKADNPSCQQSVHNIDKSRALGREEIF